MCFSIVYLIKCCLKTCGEGVLCIDFFLSTTLYLTNLMHSGSKIEALPYNSQVKYVTIK